MLLELKRTAFGKSATMGELFINGEAFCFTLEPSVSAPEHPAIPARSYGVEVTYSPKFKRRTPEIVRVPKRTAIRIHRGNTCKDTSGCILVGLHRDGMTLLESTAADDQLMYQLNTALAAGDSVRIVISEEKKK